MLLAPSLAHPRAQGTSDARLGRPSISQADRKPPPSTTVSLSPFHYRRPDERTLPLWPRQTPLPHLAFSHLHRTLRLLLLVLPFAPVCRPARPLEGDISSRMRPSCSRTETGLAPGRSLSGCGFRPAPPPRVSRERQLLGASEKNKARFRFRRRCAPCLSASPFVRLTPTALPFDRSAGRPAR